METMHAAGRRNLPPVPRPASDVPVADVPAPDAPAPSAGSPEESTAERTMTLHPRVPDDAPGRAPEDGTADDDTAVLPPVVDPDDPDATLDATTDDAATEDADATTDDDATAEDADVTADDTDVTADDTDVTAADADAEDAAATAAADAAADADAEDAALDPAVLAAADEPEHALEDDDPAQGFVSRLRAAAADFAAAAGAQTAVVREAVPPARHRRSRCRVVLQYTDGAEADLIFLGAVGRPGTPAWQDFDQQIQQWLGTGQQRQPAWLVEDSEAPDGVAVDVPAWLAAG